MTAIKLNKTFLQSGSHTKSVFLLLLRLAPFSVAVCGGVDLLHRSDDEADRLTG